MSGQFLRLAAVTLRSDNDFDHPWCQRVASWLADEAVHADEAEYVAAHAQNVAMTTVAPAYRPSTLHALAVARAYLGRAS